MAENKKVKFYSLVEERINIVSHAVGIALSAIALILLIQKSSLTYTFINTASVFIYGFSLIILYAVSTLYHATKTPGCRARLRVFDHASIYILIAGTYSPFALITISGKLGWVIFGVAWGLAFAGVILKVFFTGKYKLVSTLTYLGMGWMVLFFAAPLSDRISTSGLTWLIAGGVSYSVGAALYGLSNIKFNHAIFHLFVLIGSFTHFMAIFFHVLPSK